MLLWAALGFVAGWLINLIADAWPHRQPLALPHCPHCHAPRRLLQWSGLVAYLTGQTHCRECTQRISIRWPLVELIAIALYAYVFFLFGLSLQLLLITFYSSVLLLVCVIDFEHRLILNRVMVPSILAAVALSFVTPNLTPLAAVAGGFTGLLLTGIIYLGGVLFVRVQARRGRIINEVAFGQGDVVLMLFIGLITGLSSVVRALVLGVLLGGVVAVGIVLFGLLQRQSKLYVPYAYGPYLAMAGWYVLIQNAVTSSQ